MADEVPSEVLFRASKRRKIIRKPGVESDAEQATDEVITEPSFDAAEAIATGVVLVKKRGAAGKTGINFSTTQTRRGPEIDDRNEHRSLALVGDGDESQTHAIDRFVKPTGRVGPTEDRHMIAYIDSKLAESRSSANAPQTNSDSEHVKALSIPNDTDAGSSSGATLIASSLTQIPHPPSTVARTMQAAQERSRSTYQRPTRRKAAPARKEADVARDSMIEQLMGENQVPHYEHATTVMGEDMADDVDDPDAAAEDAFKAQLLADLELNQRRRKPAGKTSGAAAPTGPKLGGSRSQREKMKALEEAKGVAGKK